MIIYRLDLTDPPTEKPLLKGSRWVVVSGLSGAIRHFHLWVKNWGWRQAVQAFLKVLTGRRMVYFSVVEGKKLVQSGWANIGFCRYYPVERNSVVLGTLYTSPEFRGQGISTSAKSHVISFLYKRGYRRFYADTSPANVAAQKTSEKLGFQRIELEETNRS